MFSKILVPLDGSEIAATVLPRVIEIATAFKSKVTLFHVCYSSTGPMLGQATPGVIESAAAEEKKFCDTFLAKSGQDLKSIGLDADWVCHGGDPAREIIALAQDKGYDLIVMGTHGAGEVVWYMGGVANKVSSHATVPVLLLRTVVFKSPLVKEVYSSVPGVG